MPMLQFDPPGPGSWARETVHLARPIPRLYGELFPPALGAGMRDSFRRYGFLLDRMDMAVVNGFVYGAVRPVGAPPGARRPPPKPVFLLLTRLHPEIRARVKTAGRIFSERPWLADLERWDRHVKPASIAEHLAIGDVDPDSLDRAALADYVDRCCRHATRMVTQHHEFTPAAMVPIADLMARTRRWTGLGPGDVLPLMEGASTVSRGWIDGIDRVVDAIRADSGARGLLASDAPAASVLEQLAARPGDLGDSVRAWLRMVGNRLVDGLDIGSPTAIEKPSTLVKCLRTLVDSSREADPAVLADRTEAVRDKVPPEHRVEFDEMLADARAVYRIRDERGVYSDVWAGGLLRRALLAAGRRLAAEGRLHEPAHLLDAGLDDLRPLILGTGGPRADELAARARTRAEMVGYDAPEVLGPTPSGPPPTDWLPARARRLAEAVDVFLANMFDPQRDTGRPGITGAPGSPGIYEGTARLVVDYDDFDRIERGDVLVSPTTTEAFNVVVPLVGAIVTDHGGPMAHAAIVAREAGIPAVVGCRDATARIADGDRVRVDGSNGEVTVIAR